MKMNLIKEFKGNYVKLVVLFTIISMVLSLFKGCAQLIFPEQTLYYQVTAFIFSMLSMIVMNTICLALLMIHRKEKFTREVIQISLKKAPHYIVCTFLLSLMQLIATILFAFTAYIPLLYLVSTNVISLVFLIWNLLVVFAIIDGKSGITSMLFHPFHILSDNWKTFGLHSIPFILWMMIGQQILFAALSSTLKGMESFGEMTLTLQAAFSLSSLHAVSIIAVYGGFYVIQFMTLLPLYMLATMLYEAKKEVKTKHK